MKNVQAILLGGTCVVAGVLLTITAGLSALYQWALALYRLSLYDGRPGMNHADDYPGIYQVALWAAPMGLIAAILLWRYKKWPRYIALFTVITNIFGAIVFFTMHRLGILVTYDEYINGGSYAR